MPSELEIYTFPRLKSAKREVNANHLDYKSGASFSGCVKGAQRSGTGVFSWPNGDRYNGEYADNERHGKGEQLWADGSWFRGSFIKDVRHGYGEITWQNGESFKGNYFKDHRHGDGVYTWPDGSSFQGTFYKNAKEGYGVFKFPSGKRFEGLYKDDERCGPGVLTYPDGSQDFGLWHRERLISFCSVVNGAFSLSEHEHREFNDEECEVDGRSGKNESQERKSNFRDCISPEVGSGDASSFNLRDIMSSLESTNFKTNFETFQPGHPESIDLSSLRYDQEEYNREFFGEDPVAEEESDRSTTNQTPFCIAMLEHIRKHRNRENTMPFTVADILKGERCCHGDKGPIETASEALITASLAGDYDVVSSLVTDGAVDVNVADKNGNTALLGAAVNMHQRIINLLLDNGADVNKLNNEGLSSLAACHVLFYPMDSFKYNIAERYLPRPPGEDDGPPSDDGSQEGTERSFTRSRPPSSHRSRDPRAASSQASSSLIYDRGSPENLSHPGTGRGCRAEDVGENGEDGEEDIDEDEDIDDKDDFFDLVSTAVTEEQVENENEEEIPEWDPDAAQSETRESLGKGVHHGVEPASSYRSSDSPTEVETKAESRIERDTYSLLDFESNTSLVNYRIKVTDDLIERSATVMSQNKGITSGRSSRCSDPSLDEARRRAIAKAEHSQMEATIRLLLKRGADPNSSSVPMPVIFFAVKATDVEAVQALLEKGALTTSRLSSKKDGLSALHIASALRGPEGVDITRLILEAGADPNMRALDCQDEDEEEFDFGSGSSSPVKIRSGLDDGVFQYYYQLQELGNHRGGRTALHITCSRDDDYELSRQIVRLLLEKGANPNVLCMGQSPLSLAIASGNDLAVDELLRFGANPSLPLGHHTGSALCISSNTRYEFRREPSQRIALIDKLVEAGANILAPVPVGGKKQMGTAVDYAYWKFNQDRRIAHMPYHALTYSERDTYNARRKLLAHLGNILRSAAVQRERERLHQEATEGMRSVSPSQDFLYTGAGARLESPTKSIMTKAQRKESAPGSSSESLQEASGGKQVVFHSVIKDSTGQFQPLVDKENGETILRKPLFKYCYECGRALGVRLSACTRCKEVYYCSKACKVKGWNARHKEECVRVNGRSRSPSPSGKGNTEGGRDNTVGAAGGTATGGSGGPASRGANSRQQHITSNSQEKARGGRGGTGSTERGSKSTSGMGNRSLVKQQQQGTKSSEKSLSQSHKRGGGRDERDGTLYQARKDVTENYSFN